MTDQDWLTKCRYLSLATFRRNGAEVRTPVWFAQDDGCLYVFSAADAGKVKRLRREGSARIAQCDARGAVLGAWQPVVGTLIHETSEVARALSALRTKYGWQMWLTDALSRLSGRFHRRQYIALRLTE